VQITNSTIARNHGVNGGGIATTSRAGTNLQNIVVAHNTASNGSPDCAGQIGGGAPGTLLSLVSNLIGDPTGCPINLLSSDLTGDPGLGDFTDNGTPGTGHFLVLAGSQVIDAGNPDACLETDQIGSQRVGPCDIGSVEFGGELVVAIDIRPWTDKDRINPNSSQNINVAILSANGFDATLIDPNTVRSGATGTEAASYPCRSQRCK
jgi:hypothetical protein